MALIQSHFVLTRRGGQNIGSLRRISVEGPGRRHYLQAGKREVRRGWENQYLPHLELNQPAFRL